MLAQPERRSSRPDTPDDTAREMADARAELNATREILRLVATSRSDAQPVFEAIARLALELCHAYSANVFTYDGRLLHIGALAIVDPKGIEAMRSIFPRPASRETGACRAVLTRQVEMIPDVTQDPDFSTHLQAVAAGFRSVLAVPLMHGDMPIGAIAVGRPEPGPFPARQLALLQTFADQAVVAIENARQFREIEARNRELAEALQQQTATSEILRVISRSPPKCSRSSTPSRPQRCGCATPVRRNVLTFDGEFVHLAAVAAAHPEAAALVHRMFPRRLDRGIAACRAIEARRVVAIENVLDDPEYTFKSGAEVGFRSVVGIPLLLDGEPIGAIAVGRPVTGPFPPRQLALLQTFADQAVIAIANARQFHEIEARNRDLAKALEQQTATSDILRVISRSPGDVQPVFDTVARAALKLCGASSANVVTYDGRLIHVGAMAPMDEHGDGALQRHFATYPRPPSRDTANTRAILTRSIVSIPDVLEDREYAAGTTAIAAGYRSVMSVPLLRDGEPIGAITGRGPRPGAWPERRSRCCRPSPTRRSSRSRTRACSASSKRAPTSSRDRSTS